ncbi:hypothetical protein Hanom_Chr17g01554721 [Helianthus anomalus]
MYDEKKKINYGNHCIMSSNKISGADNWSIQVILGMCHNGSRRVDTNFL